MIGALLSSALIGLVIRGYLPGLVALVAFVPLLASLRSARNPFGAGLLCAVGTLGVLLATFEGALPVLPWLMPIAVLFAMQPAFLAGVAFRWLGPATMAGRSWSFPFFWTATEFVSTRRWLWGDLTSPVSLGYSQFDSPLLSVASLAGMSGITLLVLLSNVAVESSMNARRLTPLLMLVPLLPVFLLSWTAEAPSTSAGTIEARLVQPSLDPGWNEAARSNRRVSETLLKTMIDLSSDYRSVPDLLLWPEGALPAVPDLDSGVQLTFSAGESDLLAGTLVERHSERFNSVVHVADGGAEVVFDKLAPVPIGEKGISAGRRFTVGDWGGVWSAPLICLDSLYPLFARRLAASGAQLLLVFSDDSFSRGMATPEMHLRATAFRAAETGLPLLFINASGPSAAVTPRGHVSASLARGHQGYLDVVVPFSTSPGRTPFVRFGEWLGALSVLVVLTLLGLRLARRPLCN